MLRACTYSLLLAVISSVIADPAPPASQCPAAIGKRTSSSNGDGSMATDGKLSTPWLSDASIREPEQWLAVDLEIPRRVRSISVVWHSSAAWRPGTWSVQTSNDGANWIERERIVNDAGSPRIACSESTDRHDQMTCGVNLGHKTPARWFGWVLGRWVRVMVDGSVAANQHRTVPYILWELAVCADEKAQPARPPPPPAPPAPPPLVPPLPSPPPSPANCKVAQGRPTRSFLGAGGVSSTVGDSNLAVDGQAHTPWVNAGTAGPTVLEVDLQAVYRMQSIRVQWHSEIGQRPELYTVGLSASDDSSHWEGWGTVYTGMPSDQPARAGMSRCKETADSSAGPAARVCTTTFGGRAVDARWIRIDASEATTRHTVFALWEVSACVDDAAVPPRPPPQPPAPPPAHVAAECDDARGRPTRSNSKHSGAMLVDGDNASPWISEGAQAGVLQEATIDLESNRWIQRVVIFWHKDRSWRPAQYSLQTRTSHSHEWEVMAQVDMAAVAAHDESHRDYDGTLCNLVQTFQELARSASALRCQTTLRPAHYGRFIRLSLDQPDATSFGRPYMVWELHICTLSPSPPPSMPPRGVQSRLPSPPTNPMPPPPPRWVTIYSVEVVMHAGGTHEDYPQSVLDALATTVAESVHRELVSATATINPESMSIRILVNVGADLAAANRLMRVLRARFRSASAAAAVLGVAIKGDPPEFRIRSFSAPWSPSPALAPRKTPPSRAPPGALRVQGGSGSGGVGGVIVWLLFAAAAAALARYCALRASKEERYAEYVERVVTYRRRALTSLMGLLDRVQLLGRSWEVEEPRSEELVAPKAFSRSKLLASGGLCSEATSDCDGLSACSEQPSRSRKKKSLKASSIGEGEYEGEAHGGGSSATTRLTQGQERSDQPREKSRSRRHTKKPQEISLMLTEGDSVAARAPKGGGIAMVDQRPCV